MRYFSTKEIAKLWGVSVRNVQRLLKQNRIPNAKKYGNYWMIPAHTPKPLDPRKNGDDGEALPYASPLLVMTPLYTKVGMLKKTRKDLASNQLCLDVFQAQMTYFQGDPETAWTRSEQLLQTTTDVTATLALLTNMCNCTLHMGDYGLWKEAREKMMRLQTKNQQQRLLKEMSVASVDTSLYDKRQLPHWLIAGKFEDLPMDAFPMARYVFTKHYAISRASFDTLPLLEPLCAQTMIEGIVVAEIYQRLILAIGYHDSGNLKEMKRQINRVFDLALPDKLYTPLAEERSNLGKVFDTMLKERDEDAYQAVLSIWSNLIPSWKKLYEAHLKRHFVINLTIREMEVMKYAANGLTNYEIADVMEISLSTVKSFIGNILQKTGLNDRSEFADYLSLS